MPKKPMISALISGVICAACVFLYIQSIEADMVKSQNQLLETIGSEVCDVVIATQDIHIGDSVTKNNCTIAQYPKDFLPDLFAGSFDDVAYKSATSPIFKGEVVTQPHFESLDKKKLVVPAGMVAVSVPAKDVEAVGGTVYAGVHVDVYTTASQGTDLLIENALVLDTNVGKSEGLMPSSESLAWLTLAVEPSAVEELITASHKSELYFVIKSETVR